jgi:hypothetical protein
VVAQDCTAFKSAGASSPPDANKVQSACAETVLTAAKVEAAPSASFVKDERSIRSGTFSVCGRDILTFIELKSMERPVHSHGPPTDSVHVVGFAKCGSPESIAEYT